MKVIITIGTLFEDNYEETTRGSIEVPDSASISDVLEQAKQHIAPLSPILNRERIKANLYLMNPETREKLDETKTVSDYGLKDGALLYLMSGVR